MNGQLLCGLALGAGAVVTAVLGVVWLAVATAAAAAPFLLVGILLGLGGWGTR
jgi:hypothetical protein